MLVGCLLAGLAWLAAAFGLAVLIGRAIRLADRLSRHAEDSGVPVLDSRD